MAKDEVIWGNPGALGLAAFGFNTILLQVHNIGLIPSTMPLIWGFFWGGAAQVIAGIIDARRGDTFGLTAFTSYGFFWLTLVGLWTIPEMGLGDNAQASNNDALAAFLAMWGLFTLCMFVGTLKLTRSLQFIFGSLTVLFFLLALAHMTDGSTSDTITKIAGTEGIICGFSAFYTAIAQILNEVYKKPVLPL